VEINKCCASCGVIKPVLEFNLRGKHRPGEYQNNCKQCCYEVSNRKKRQISALVKRWKLSKGCQRCGFKAEHSCQLDIDHIIPKRSKGNDRQAINTSWSKPRLKRELTGCQVLCANCHRLKTYEDGTMFQTGQKECS
jgi:5-methylcytosine-specific restriction endonuclease McrA